MSELSLSLPLGLIARSCLASFLFLFHWGYLQEVVYPAFSILYTVVNNKIFFIQRDHRKANDAVILNRRINHVAKDSDVN